MDRYRTSFTGPQKKFFAESLEFGRIPGVFKDFCKKFPAADTGFTFFQEEK